MCECLEHQNGFWVDECCCESWKGVIHGTAIIIDREEYNDLYELFKIIDKNGGVDMPCMDRLRERYKFPF